MCSELDKTGVISCYQDALITGFSGSEAARFAFTWDIEAVTSNGFISMLPLNFAPSSRLSLGHSILPRTLPVDVMMTFSKPTILPLTEPSMETILPVISAFKTPVLATWI